MRPCGLAYVAVRGLSGEFSKGNGAKLRHPAGSLRVSDPFFELGSYWRFLTARLARISRLTPRHTPLVPGIMSSALPEGFTDSTDTVDFLAPDSSPVTLTATTKEPKAKRTGHTVSRPGGTIGALPRSIHDDAFANVCPTRL